MEKSLTKKSKHYESKFKHGTTLAVKKANKAESTYHDTVRKAKGKIKAGKTRIKAAKESIHSEIHDARNGAKKIFG